MLIRVFVEVGAKEHSFVRSKRTVRNAAMVSPGELSLQLKPRSCSGVA